MTTYSIDIAKVDRAIIANFKTALDSVFQFEDMKVVDRLTISMKKIVVKI